MASRTASVLSFLGVRLASLVAGVAVLAIMARALGPTDMGIYASSVAISMTLTVIADLGFSSYALRESVRDPLITRPVVLLAFVCRLAVGLLIFGILLAVVYSFRIIDDQQWRLCLAFAGAAIPVGALQLFTNLLQRFGRYGVVTLLSVAQTIAWAGAVVALSELQSPVAFYAAAQVIIGLSSSLVLLITALRLPEVRSSRLAATSISTRVRSLLSESFSIGITSIVTSMYYRISSIAVVFVAGPFQAGLFGVASRFLDQAAVLPSTLGTAFAPLVNKAATSSHDDTLEEGSRYARYLLIVALPGAVMGFLYSSWLVDLLFGTQYEGARWPLAILGATFPLICLGWSLTSAVIAEGRSQRQVVVALVGLVTSVTAALVLSWLLGATGGALSAFATELVVCVGLLRVVMPGAWKIVPLKKAGIDLLLAVSIFIPIFLLPVGEGVRLSLSLFSYGVAAYALGTISKEDLRIPKLEDVRR